MDKQFLNKLTSLVAPVSGNSVSMADLERRPHGLPIELFQKILAKSGGLLADEKKSLRKLDEQFLACSKECDAFSFDAALHRFRDQLDAAIQGSDTAPETKADCIAQNQQSRAVLKHRLDLYSNEAKQIAAVIYSRMVSAAQEMAAELESEERGYSGADFRPSFRLVQHRVAITTLSHYIAELEKPNRIRPAHLLFQDKI